MVFHKEDFSEHKIIRGFHDDFKFLSNFYPCEVYLDEQLFKSVEHAYVAAKSTDQVFRDIVATKESPGLAKRLGRTIEVRDNWKNIRLPIMANLLRQKFQLHPYLKGMLLATNGLYIEETNWWNDTFWGVCKGVGENHLGRLLMELREELTEMEQNNDYP